MLTLFSLRSFDRIMCDEKEKQKNEDSLWLVGEFVILYFVGVMTGPLPLL